mmetsp:Transcript_4744/g.13746  ORF Transcript_4744/g.13746 Transcript_4744/m.13746 type:complete len:223 (+) Transcript_4744:161-829(+)
MSAKCDANKRHGGSTALAKLTSKRSMNGALSNGNCILCACAVAIRRKSTSSWPGLGQIFFTATLALPGPNPCNSPRYTVPSSPAPTTTLLLPNHTSSSSAISSMSARPSVETVATSLGSPLDLLPVRPGATSSNERPSPTLAALLRGFRRVPRPPKEVCAPRWGRRGGGPERGGHGGAQREVEREELPVARREMSWPMASTCFHSSRKARLSGRQEIALSSP